MCYVVVWKGLVDLIYCYKFKALIWQMDRFSHGVAMTNKFGVMNRVFSIGDFKGAQTPMLKNELWKILKKD